MTEKIEIYLKKQNTKTISKEINFEEIKHIVQELSLKFGIDLMKIIKKISMNLFDGFSINKNQPYTHLYIGNGLECVYFELMSLDKELKIEIPKGEIE